MTTFSIRGVNVVAVCRLGKFWRDQAGFFVSRRAGPEPSRADRGADGPRERRGHETREMSRPLGYTGRVGIITLTTDFGAADWFAGTMKGVILGINPRVQIVTITHEIPAGDIRAGAFALAASCKFFPKKTIHVAVVDPGVGSQRRALAVQTNNYLFVGPDNAVLSFALAGETVQAAHQLTNPKFFLQPVSQTFHGRDVFAPVAAHLSKGLPIQKLGPAVKDFLRPDWPGARISQNAVRGEIIYIDHFGNAITNLDDSAVPGLDRLRCEVFVKRKKLCGVRSCYQAVPVGEPVAVLGSCGLLEIAVNGGSAAERFGLKIGDQLTLRKRAPQESSSSS